MKTNLQIMREKLGLTTLELADLALNPTLALMGYSDVAWYYEGLITYFENGSGFMIESLKTKISKVMNCSVNELFEVE